MALGLYIKLTLHLLSFDPWVSSPVSSHTEELWYNETVRLLMTLYIYVCVIKITSQLKQFLCNTYINYLDKYEFKYYIHFSFT